MFKKIAIAAVAGSAVLASAAYAETEVQVYTKDNTETKAGNAQAGAVGGAAAGAMIGGPVGAVVGAAVGATAGNKLTPEEKVVTYVETNPVKPVIVDGDVVVGYLVPEDVVLTPVPETQYSYVYVEEQPVIVDAQTRQVVQIVN
ncbi:DUF1236 domain-containing protein [Pseudooceanicola sp. C21-150M6]|uniref:DUF1236 domain-containing protein n=1 Tax=Pseudooceanicola sp. C21-150M6 TaxID=3434355 RepID=UPI003D7FCB57